MHTNLYELGTSISDGQQARAIHCALIAACDLIELLPRTPRTQALQRVLQASRSDGWLDAVRSPESYESDPGSDAFSLVDAIQFWFGELLEDLESCLSEASCVEPARCIDTDPTHGRATHLLLAMQDGLQALSAHVRGDAQECWRSLSESIAVLTLEHAANSVSQARADSVNPAASKLYAFRDFGRKGSDKRHAESRAARNAVADWLKKNYSLDSTHGDMAAAMIADGSVSWGVEQVRRWVGAWRAGKLRTNL